MWRHACRGDVLATGLDYVFKPFDVMLLTPEGSRAKATTSVRAMEV